MIKNNNNYIPDEHLENIKSYLTKKDREIIELLIETGFRLDDVLHLRKWQLKSSSISIKERKTGNTRTVVHAPCLKNGNQLEYAFSSRRGRHKDKKHVNRTTIFRHFKEAIRKAGYAEKGYTVHSLRKVYAVRLYKATGDIKTVQEDLGHKNISTTLLYLVGALIDK